MSNRVFDDELKKMAVSLQIHHQDLAELSNLGTSDRL